MDIDKLQQSPPYANYVQRLGWTVVSLDTAQLFIKSIPFVGAFAKLQRVGPLPDCTRTQHTLRTYRVKKIVIEADELVDEQALKEWVSEIKKTTSVIQSPYIQTKTIRINLQPTLEDIFSQCTPAKRRALRRAEKNNLRVEISDDIQTMIDIKNKSAGFLGWITTKGLRELWETFGTEQTKNILVYTSRNPHSPVAGVFLLFYKQFAYYWIAGATAEGKHLFAPTLAAWKAIETAKTHGAAWFDWVGVFDERFPHEHHDWKGFTKFKEGFGGKTIYFPVHRDHCPPNISSTTTE
jgi:lipid II:glycine glycyltransferase (peptidoglycan interpeptide bridge formation enzyme)